MSNTLLNPDNEIAESQDPKNLVINRSLYHKYSDYLKYTPFERINKTTAIYFKIDTYINENNKLIFLREKEERQTFREILFEIGGCILRDNTRTKIDEFVDILISEYKKFLSLEIEGRDLLIEITEPSYLDKDDFIDMGLKYKF